MLQNILDYLNNYFVRTRELFTAVVSDGITGTFSKTYAIGQYISIDNTLINNGVYKITGVSTSKLTLDATLTAETVTGVVWGLAIPKVVLTLATEIASYDSTSQKGVMSESQGNRSISYGNGTTSGSSNWQSVYKSNLMPYKKIYSDKVACTRRW
jgi:hypothetical protein